MKPFHSSHRGFTIVELMVVVAILGVLATLAAPSFTQLLRKQRVNAAVADVRNALALARVEAVRTRTPTLLISITNYSAATNAEKTCRTGVLTTRDVWTCGLLVVSDVDRDGQFSNGDTILRQYSPFAGAEVQQSNAVGGNGVIRYNTDGTVGNSMGRLVFTPDGVGVNNPATSTLCLSFSGMDRVKPDDVTCN